MLADADADADALAQWRIARQNWHAVAILSPNVRLATKTSSKTQNRKARNKHAKTKLTHTRNQIITCRPASGKAVAEVPAGPRDYRALEGRISNLELVLASPYTVTPDAGPIWVTNI